MTRSRELSGLPSDRALGLKNTLFLFLVGGGWRQLINLIPRGLRFARTQSVNMAGDGYVFDFKVEVVRQFCFQIHACGTGCVSQVSGYGLQVPTHASRAGAEGRAGAGRTSSAWISFLDAEKPAGMAGFFSFTL